MKRALATKRRRDIAAKALSIGGVSWEFMLPGTSFNYAREVGDGLRSGVIVAALNWLMRAFPEAPLVVERLKDEVWQVQHGHPLVDLLKTPNPYYDGRVLWMATVMDFAFGEAYWQIIRNGLGKAVELWWVPRALIRPIYDDAKWPNVWVHHYAYRPGVGPEIELSLDDVVHFRFGMDPANPRRGFSQLAAIFREVYIDDQAANFTAAILRNLGIIGLIFSPKTGVPGIPPGKLDEFKKYVQENFTADKRGQAMAFSHPIDAQVLAYNLQGFNVGPIRDVAEERVCSALGIPAAVIGFGTGLQTTKVGATMREMRQMAYEQAVMPTHQSVASELDRSLIPEFQGDNFTALFRTRFDTSRIHALWEDDLQKSQRIAAAVEGSLITVGEGRRELGYPVDETAPGYKDYYLRKVTVQAVPADEPMKPVERITATVPATEPAPGSEEETTIQKPPPEGTSDGGGADV